MRLMDCILSSVLMRCSTMLSAVIFTAVDVHVCVGLRHRGRGDVTSVSLCLSLCACVFVCEL